MVVERRNVRRAPFVVLLRLLMSLRELCWKWRKPLDGAIMAACVRLKKGC